MKPELFTDPAEWQARCASARDGGARVVLVPTMGFLHEGHLSLMREARARADEQGKRGLVAVSIFVNPTQFGPTEDLSRYPRDLEGDLAKCASAGVDRVLAPASPELVFPPSHQTWVEVTGVSQGLCGASRPGHFRGVATVVAKLFNLTRPHVALFGEKDYQQLQVIRTMARELAMGVEVAGMPIVREADGLALSSRNAYLSKAERERALSLSRSLHEARDRVAGGERDAAALRAGIERTLSGGVDRIDYVELVHPDTLAPVAQVAPGTMALVAAYVGKTRLIDNVKLP
ncbi:MAG TPA: pantoate--beta-alanine ligase [Anaeromyxobacteraceae bacterium]|nr:pantoate--beta-alanine ligase [Anaeromyxobacteraceae bacterium]